MHRGDRVYFSETLIIFTSNLGIYSTAPDGSRRANVTPDQPFAEVRSRVRAEIGNHFKLVLNRPEILNRFGENVIVFDFIRPAVAEDIFASMVRSVLSDAETSGHQITLSAEARETLRHLCTADLSNGGRGIRNQIEAHLINPLARALFDRDGDGPVTVVAVEAGARRAAVLEGLTGLGYEVAEGMRTAWAQDGRLVLRSASRPDYGVEVNAAGERMQMRPVAFDAGGVGPDPSRDRDAETIWCGDVSALQETLGNAGGGLVIEKSLPIGATPLKRIAVAAGEAAAAAAAPVLRERTIR